jgi:hypothetical protein
MNCGQRINEHLGRIWGRYGLLWCQNASELHRNARRFGSTRQDISDGCVEWRRTQSAANPSPPKFPVMQGINREFYPESAFLAKYASRKLLRSLRFFGKFPTQRNRELLWRIRELKSLNRELRGRIRQSPLEGAPSPLAAVALDAIIRLTRIIADLVGRPTPAMAIEPSRLGTAH